ncbi:MAG: DUF5379 domain-containing protein [Euryarchaeota archaeon]|nr:DUF5379 domain-containing protein [Euryarchaeota archaeon]
MDAETKTIALHSISGFIAGILCVIVKTNWVGALLAFGILALSIFITTRVLKISTETLGGSTMSWVGNAIWPFLSIWLVTWILLYNLM